MVVMYHAAPPERRGQILQDGLRPSDPRNLFGGSVGVYLFRDELFATNYDQNRPMDVWAVNVRGLELLPDPEDPAVAVYTLQTISPNRLRLIGTFIYGEELVGHLKWGRQSHSVRIRGHRRRT